MMNTYRILSFLIALSLLLAACASPTTPQPTATLLPPTVTPTPIPPTPTLSPEQQQKIIVENKIKRHLTALGMTTCENCTIKNLPDNSTEALVQKVVDKDGKEQEIILSVVSADGKETPYKLWKMKSQNITGSVVGDALSGTKVVDDKGITSHIWDAKLQEWKADSEYLVQKFEIPKDHADYFWFNPGLSSMVVNINGKTEELLSGQINCFPVGRRHEIQASSGVEMMFVDCIIQTPTGEKRKITLVFDTLAYWKDLPPKNPQPIKIIQNSRDEKLLQLIDEAISQKKQIGVDVTIAHKLASSNKKECGLNCAGLSYAVNSSSSDLLDFFLSMGGAGKNIEILSVNGLYSEILQKTNLTEPNMSQFQQILRSRGWLIK